MSDAVHHCPTCGRPFAGVFDYPRIEVLEFERLPLPEAMDEMSDEAAKLQMARRRQGLPARVAFSSGINMTPEIERACARAEMQHYLERLSQLKGQTIVPSDLRPPFAAHPQFKGAFEIPESPLSLGLHDETTPSSDRGCAHVDVMSDGPNLGSAGGPTLQVLGTIARLHYRGLLVSDR